MQKEKHRHMQIKTQTHAKKKTQTYANKNIDTCKKKPQTHAQTLKTHIGSQCDIHRKQIKGKLTHAHSHTHRQTLKVTVLVHVHKYACVYTHTRHIPSPHIFISGGKCFYIRQKNKQVRDKDASPDPLCVRECVLCLPDFFPLIFFGKKKHNRYVTQTHQKTPIRP